MVPVPTQVPEMAKQPTERSSPLLNVEVAVPVWFKASTSNPPLNVEVDCPSAVAAEVFMVNIGIASVPVAMEKA